jgi:hypothetical protein
MKRNGVPTPFVKLVKAGPIIDASRAHTSYIGTGFTSFTIGLPTPFKEGEPTHTLCRPIRSSPDGGRFSLGSGRASLQHKAFRATGNENSHGWRALEAARTVGNAAPNPGRSVPR